MIVKRTPAMRERVRKLRDYADKLQMEHENEAYEKSKVKIDKFGNVTKDEYLDEDEVD
jgi:hypothetical protein